MAQKNIPKKIHYVWSFNKPKPRLMLACLTSWTATMPDYELIEWNENTLDYDQLSKECEVFNKAKKIRLWSYVADYVRFKVLYEHGGIYLDTDVQVIKKFDALLHHRFFAGFHQGFKDGKRTDDYVEGAVMGSISHHPFVKSMIEFYQNDMMKYNIPYLPYAINRVLNKKYSTSQLHNATIKIQEGIQLYDTRYFHPFLNGDFCTETKKVIHPETYAIHWFRNSYGDKNSLSFYIFMNHRASTLMIKVKASFIFIMKGTYFRASGKIKGLLKKILNI